MKKLRKLIVITLLISLAGATGLVGWATLSAQEATKPAITVLDENNIQLQDGMLVFPSSTPTDKDLIYYPDGLVDPEAYAVTAKGISDEGYLVVIPRMPLNLAFMSINRADKVQSQYPEIESWIIGGHSLGGAMAAQYAKNNVNHVDGLIMFASYPANSDDFIDFPLPILTIIASNDPGTPKQRAFYETVAMKAELIVIEGGNHRNYADYSFQRNDGIASIPAEEQQRQIISAVVQFLEGIE